MSIRRVLYISKSILVFLLLYTVFKTTASIGYMNSVLAPVSAKASTQPIQQETISLPKLSIEDYAQIVKKDPFGTSNHEAISGELRLAANPARSDSLFAQKSGLTLMGTVSGSNSIARAIIKINETDMLDFYKIGQLVGNARIDSIEANAVTLIYDGQRKILPITSWASNNHVQSSRLASLPTDPEKNKAVTANKTALDRPETGIRKKYEYVQEILAKSIIKPYIVDGESEGLRITGLEKLAFAKKIGLKNGDVISAVNGHQLTNKRKANQILKKARRQKELSLDLMREDKHKNISFALL